MYSGRVAFVRPRIRPLTNAATITKPAGRRCDSRHRKILSEGLSGETLPAHPLPHPEQSSCLQAIRFLEFRTKERKRVVDSGFCSAIEDAAYDKLVRASFLSSS